MTKVSRFSILATSIFLVVSVNGFFFNKQHPNEDFPPECPIRVEPSSQRCSKERKADITKARAWYKISNSQSSINFPLARIVPWLEQNVTTVSYHYALDPFESRYMILFNTFLTLGKNVITPRLEAIFLKLPFITNKEYVMLNLAFNKAIQALNAPQYFDNPTIHASSTDHVTNGYWMTDDAFSQRRLAGQCPFLLKKVIKRGNQGYKVSDLKSLINQTFFKTFKLKLDEDGEELLTVNQAVNEGRLFVLHIPEMTNVTTVPDILDENTSDHRVLSKLRSPIGFFVLRKDGMIRIAAIQRDPVPDSKVFTPASHPQDWLLAKAELEQTADTFCQARLHLGGVHWVSTIYCLSFRRHLSTQHPLYDFFKYHCEGTVPHISLSWPSLAVPGSEGHQYFSMGHEGFIRLSTEEYNERNYDKLLFSKLIKGHGLDDSRIKYYPFRDDTKIILREFTVLVNKIVDTYYSRWGWFSRSSKIQQDRELQSWVNEISIHGKKLPNGGKGKMVGFPPVFRRAEQLKTFLSRFLWNNIFHTSINYALVPNFLPISPTKLYEYTDGKKMSYLQAVPGAAYSVGATTFRGILSSMRINRIFGYWSKLANPVFRDIVRTAYLRMRNRIQKKLQTRNAERKSRNQLGYQILEPIWMTNSIHI